MDEATEGAWEGGWIAVGPITTELELGAEGGELTLQMSELISDTGLIPTGRILMGSESAESSQQAPAESSEQSPSESSQQVIAAYDHEEFVAI